MIPKIDIVIGIGVRFSIFIPVPPLPPPPNVLVSHLMIYTKVGPLFNTIQQSKANPLRSDSDSKHQKQIATHLYN